MLWAYHAVLHDSHDPIPRVTAAANVGLVQTSCSRNWLTCAVLMLFLLQVGLASVLGRSGHHVSNRTGQCRDAW
jgi:hypothetical protein